MTLLWHYSLFDVQFWPVAESLLLAHVYGQACAGVVSY